MTLPLNLAFADASTSGSDILNGQVNFNVAVSKLNTNVDGVSGDAGGQSIAGGNVVDITTMNDTNVNNEQYNSSATISSTLNANVANVGGSVGYQSQAVCNSASVSTDPNITQVYSNQECRSVDPTSTLNASVSNVGGDVSLAGSAIGNSFEADSNASNMPLELHQINSSAAYSTVNANVANVGGSTSATSAAIGNNAEIIHYTTTQ
jgi:hypothetical protein